MGLMSIWVLLFSFSVTAKFSTEPLGCLEKFSPPCSVLTETKSEFQNSSFKMFTSKDALFQYQSADKIYLARGILWLQVASNELTVQGKFGNIIIRQAGEYWIEMLAEKMVVRSLKESLAVVPRGASEIVVNQGFEMTVSYVDVTTHAASYSVPMVISLAHHLADVPRVAPQTGFNIQEYATHLGRVLLEAAQDNAAWYQAEVQRKVSSAEAYENRLKYEAIHNAKRDAYLQKLYRLKNNFEDQ